jgi:cytoskeletal protein CcmA (bactofilin family)
VDNNTIIISKDTLFEGAISAAHIIIEGKVVGDIKATSSILIQGDGWVQGDINAPRIYLAKGCHHEGAIYLDDLENASPSKIHMNRLEFTSDNEDKLEDKEKEASKVQPDSNRTPTKLS